MVSGTTAEPSLPCHMVTVSEMSRNGQPYSLVLIIFRVFNFRHCKPPPKIFISDLFHSTLLSLLTETCGLRQSFTDSLRVCMNTNNISL